MLGNNAQIYENMRLYVQIVRKLVETGRLSLYEKRIILQAHWLNK